MSNNLSCEYFWQGGKKGLILQSNQRQRKELSQQHQFSIEMHEEVVAAKDHICLQRIVAKKEAKMYRG